jgi:hypothetical protein
VKGVLEYVADEDKNTVGGFEYTNTKLDACLSLSIQYRKDGLIRKPDLSKPPKILPGLRPQISISFKFLSIYSKQ